MAKENDSEILKRIDQFHQFYSSAWNKLVQMVLMGFVIVGLVIPGLSMFLQWRSFKSEAESIKRDLLTEQQSVLEGAQKEVGQQITEFISEFRGELDAVKRQARVDRYTAQAESHEAASRIHYSQRRYLLALGSAVRAAHCHLLAECKSGFENQVDYMVDDLLPNIDRNSYRLDSPEGGPVKTYMFFQAHLEKGTYGPEYADGAKRLREAAEKAFPFMKEGYTREHAITDVNEVIDVNKVTEELLEALEELETVRKLEEFIAPKK